MRMMVVLLFFLNIISLRCFGQDSIEFENRIDEYTRIALVIGNGNYQNSSALKNPINDAELISAILRELEFTVIERFDADKASIENAVREFAKKLPENKIAVFYYAGHGMQVDGINYIIPTDAKVNETHDCKYEAVPIDFVIGEFEKYPENINIVILDACRNNPFRSWSRGTNTMGFTVIPPASGTLIAFATSEGATALDGEGENGLFTEEFAQQLTVPQPIESVFKKTRIEVERRSNGMQSPQEWSKLKCDFSFVKTETNPANQNILTPQLGQIENMITYGSILLFTELAGELFIDSKYVGSINANTKVPITRITAGSHAIKIVGDGIWISTVNVYSDEYTELHANKKEILDYNEKMVFIKGGSFQMGSNDYEAESDEQPLHTVTLNDFYIGKFEVTNEEYCKFLNEEGNQIEGGVEWINLNGNFNHERCRISQANVFFKVEQGYEKTAVNYVSWYGARAYCDWLKRKTGDKYRLPTEAEWEFASKGGVLGKGYKFSGSNYVDDVAFYANNANVRVHLIGQKLPNELGLFDMSGNVWEWCNDWYSKDYYSQKNIKQNPQGASFSSKKVIRGGGWGIDEQGCRTSNREFDMVSRRRSDLGFRIVYVPL